MRALFVFDWRKLCSRQLALIKACSEDYDELIFLVDRAEELPSCGTVLAQLNAIFCTHLDKPFYLLPIVKKQPTDLYHWLRWRILLPEFQKVYVDDGLHKVQMQHALRTPVEVVASSPDLICLDQEIKKSRGLFVMRAQPPHLGHAAIVERMGQEVEEVIVVIAMANQSHTVTNIATAGERLAMTLPLLNERAPRRHYLMAFPYSDFSMENLYELEYLLPSFDFICTHNPAMAVLAKGAGYPVKTYTIPQSASSTLIRECMLNDIPWQHLVPASVHAFLERSGIPDRLKQLQQKEVRCVE